MNNQIITEIKQQMCGVLNNSQMEILNQVLNHYLWNLNISRKEAVEHFMNESDNVSYLDLFIAAKRVEGCSEKTIKYYKSTIQNMLNEINKGVKHVTTEDLREYLSTYEKNSKAGKVTLDNVRRILSSFFSWLEDESHILKSPVRRIHRVKTAKTVKETYSDETLEILRDSCDCPRDLAIIDLLSSTGMRVGELVQLNISDIDFENRECVVFGKGSKERPVYFDARTKIHLQNYLNSRTDDNPALFVTLNKPNLRLQISGVEIRVRRLGKKLNIPKVHPHKFRRTLATRAIDKGMPIEQVQRLLGHAKIDTTMQYAMVNQTNVKNSHRKYIS